MTTNQQFKELIAAKTAYDNHVEDMRAKYGYQYTDAKLMASEMTEQALTTADYIECTNLFVR